MILDCLHLTGIYSFKLGSMSNYVDGLQALPQVQDLNEFIFGHVRNLSDVWIYFFTKICSLITNRLVFLACRATFKNTFDLFQSKVWFAIFYKELRHRRLGGLKLARIHSIW